MKVNHSEVVALYTEQSMTAKAISDKLGIAQRHVYRILTKHDVELRERAMTDIDVSKVDLEGRYMPEPNSGCWLWDGATFDDDYGCIVVKGKHLKAHRVSYTKHKGPIPKGKKILHKCDVRPCINPDHLFPGTDLENQQDMKAKKRSTHGERSGNAKLTEADVRAIRASDLPGRQTAEQYGVSQVLISLIRRNKIWENVK